MVHNWETKDTDDLFNDLAANREMAGKCLQAAENDGRETVEGTPIMSMLGKYRTNIQQINQELVGRGAI